MECARIGSGNEANQSTENDIANVDFDHSNEAGLSAENDITNTVADPEKVADFAIARELH